MKNFKKVLFTGTLTAVALLTISTYTNAATVKITGEVVNIRKEASTESSVVARLSEDVECEYIGEKGNWYQIKYKNYTGYVSKDYAKLQGTVSNNQGSSNTQSNTTAQNNTTANNNNVQNNTQTSNEQTNQTTNNQNNTQTNNENNATQTTNTQPVNKKFKQNSTIKILPLVHASNIGNAKTSDTVLVLAEASGWSYIQTDEISGWVRTTSLEDSKTTTQVNSKPTDSGVSKDNTQAEKLGYISEEEVNMRKGAGTNYSIIKTLKLNAQVTILGEEGKWYKVKAGSDTGYISKDYVSDTAKVTNRSLTEPRDSKEDTAKNEENEKETNNTSVTKTANTTNTSSTTASNKTSTTNEKNTTSNTTNSNNTIKGTDVVAYAKKYLGYKYVWGGDGSNGTFDCSGFTMYVYKHFGVSLPHYTVSQYNSGKGKKITKQSDLKMGDIVYLTDYVTGAPCGHCGIYISDGMFIHADSTVMKVNISDLNGMYKGRFCGALRIIQ